ncbi:putative bifunctional diguanylate cyclase/phosphodiesterase [Tardiphaga sp. 71_E8_N1_1]|uniref:putative bifunctional diguanylate cyclase/phosphodiesterase n=1 Tax=Tardiphaga sp. 71_E8_N1_1 TaxID=3240784 RepID=UPI003F8BDF93
MSLAAASIYWIIVCLWSAILVTVAVAFARNATRLGSAKLLLVVVMIDTVRNILENVYFGAYFGAQYGFFSHRLTTVLGQPYLLILPKLANVAAALIVLSLLVFRWLPHTQREKANAEIILQETKQALDQESEEHRRLFETSVDLIVVTDADRIIRRISDSCETILGYRSDELLNRYGGEMASLADIASFRNELDKTLRGGVLQNVECRFRHKHGHDVVLQISGVWSARAQRFFLIGRDMTASKLASEKLSELAHFDQLTKLPNRTSFVRDFSAFMADEASRPSALAMLDLDGFKDVNDTLGHSFGDQVLKQMAARLAAAAPLNVDVYRFGGDEFALLLRDCRDPLAAQETITRMFKAIETPIDLEGQRITLRASAGLAFAPRDARTLDELTASADLALYDAKGGGGRKCRLFMPSMRASAQARLDMDTELRRAAETGQFELYFQPQVDLSTGVITGAEALLRWNHPTKGLVAPGAFIDALANSPIAPEVGRWIIDETCKWGAKYNASRSKPFRVAVNLFPCQFKEGTLLRDIEQSLARHELLPQHLEAEITENIALGDHTILSTLRSLRSLGVQLAFDDFGTGFASLACIAKYPLTRIKIDKSFVQNIAQGAGYQETAIATSIIMMAHNLSLSVTAEGVETEEQGAFLKCKGCDEAQGYLYARPMPANELLRILSESPVAAPAWDAHGAYS